MARIEDQRILVWCKQKEEIKNTLLDAVYLAIKLEKEVCLFACYDDEKEKQRYKHMTNLYAETIQKDMPSLKLSVLLLKGSLHKLMRNLGENYNAILFCAGPKLNRKLLKAFYNAGFPFFFSRKAVVKENRFKKLMIPLDFRNTSKDATLWGSYLGRFNQSDVVLKVANEKRDNELRAKVKKNEAFVKKFYSQFLFNYYFEKTNSNSWNVHKAMLKEAENFDLYIFSGSYNASLPDKIVGPFEMRIVNKCKSNVLLTNPKKEMYLLCS